MRISDWSSDVCSSDLQGLAYPCFCTRAGIAAEIAASLSAPHGSGGPLYPGTCRKLDGAERSVRLAWEPHGWRIDMAKAAVLAGPLTWQDERAGTIMADPVGEGEIDRKSKSLNSSQSCDTRMPS